MVRNSWKLLCLITGAAVPITAQETAYVCTEGIVYQVNQSKDEEFRNVCIKHPGDIAEIVSTSKNAAEIIEKIGRAMLTEHLFHYGFLEGYTEEEQRALTREAVAHSEYGQLSIAGMRRMAYFFNQMPPRFRASMEFCLFQPISTRSSTTRSLTLGEAFDLGCQCALDLHNSSTALFPGTSAQKSAVIWGLYLPSIVIARWVTDDISEEQVHEIVNIQKHVLNRFVVTALPHLYQMWISLMPLLPQIREALQEPVNDLLIDFQRITAELMQEYEPDPQGRVYGFDYCECSYHLDGVEGDTQDRALCLVDGVCTTEECTVKNSDECPCNQKPRVCVEDTLEQTIEEARPAYE